MNAGTRDGQRLWADRWVVTFVLCGMTLAALTIVVSSFGVVGAERALYQWIAEQDTPSLEDIFNWIDELGDEGVLLAAALLLTLALPSRRGRPWWLLIAVLVLSSGLEELVKKIVGRSGPGGAGNGFPSGEVAAATGFFVIAAYLVQQAVATEIGKAALWGVAVTCVVLVSVGCIAMHTQWPLDTLGGAALGLASAAALVCMVKADQMGSLRQMVGALGLSLTPWSRLFRSACEREETTTPRSDDGAEPSLFLRVLYYLYQRRLMVHIRGGPMPRHIGIILDGNRRYGAQRGLTEAKQIYLLGARKLDDIPRLRENPKTPLAKRRDPDFTERMIRPGFLDIESRQNLIELARDGLAAHRLARRANALVLLDDGMSCEAIAKVLLLDDDTIRTWYRLYEEDGIEGLTNFSYEGSACQLSGEQQEKLKAWVATALPRTTRQVGAWIENEFGVVYEGRSGLIALLHRLGSNITNPMSSRASSTKKSRRLSLRATKSC